MINALILDIEIKKAIPPKDGQRLPGIEYCDGWRDFANMGIAVVGAYDLEENQPRVFCDDNLHVLRNCIELADVVVTFNGDQFDLPLLRFNGVHVPKAKSFDLLREIWIACGLDPGKFDPRTHAGFTLEAMSVANFGDSAVKTGRGDLAPILWQQGKHGQLFDYCLRDVRLTLDLFEAVLHCPDGLALPPGKRSKEGTNTVYLPVPPVLLAAA